MYRVMMVLGCLLLASGRAQAGDIVPDRLADAIYLAEGGNKTSHPYGIMHTYKHTTPRQACLNTIASNLRRWDWRGDFIEFLGRTYCPPDAHPLNKNWVKNVRGLYDKQTV